MGKTVRCKMRCEHVHQDEYAHSVRMVPVTGGSEENEQFFKATPGGQLELSVMNQQHFEPGKEYYIDISEAVKEEQAQ